ncbi:MAG: TraR/DksA family transcriptional regulator [Planctomycetes bacterium]|nr:TraR/DksA family transcriptional regulator [Planctomycetota bacterium]
MPSKKQPKLSAKDLEEFKVSLIKARAVLSGDLSQLHEEAFGQNGNVDASESRPGDTSDGYYQEFNLQLLERDEETLQQVLDAIERVNNGTFGQCEGCENMIAKERLRAVPHARFCIDCQRQAERRGGL